MLKYPFRKCSGRMWSELIWLRRGISGVKMAINLRVLPNIEAV
jgi:hypothetical protein